MTKYPFIWAWCYMLHTSVQYAEKQEALAAIDYAPERAIFKAGDRWYTVDEIVSDQLRTEIIEDAKRFNTDI